MGYTFSNDHSFATVGTLSGFHNPSTTCEFGQDQIFGSIGHVPSPAQVLQPCGIVQTLPQEANLQPVEHHRYDIASSIPEHLPHPQNCLPESSTNSWTENNLLPATFDRPYHFGGSPGHSTTDVYSSARPPPNSLTAPVAWHVCMACDRSYKNSGGLGKHQRTVCERTHYWTCRLCRHQVFEKLSELHQHHRSIHGNTCVYCNDVTKSSPSDRCNASLSRCSIETVKKAWGCPCCINCFNTLEGWNNHKISHQVHNEKVVNWSFSTMVKSLLRHHDLLAASEMYDWSLCSWAYMGKDQYQSLRFALERHVIPSTMFHTENYSHLSMPQSLVLHTFRLGIVGNTPIAPPNVFGCQTVISAPSAYSNVSIDQSPGFEPTNLGFQQLEDSGRDNNFESDENQHRSLITLETAPDDVEDQEEPASMGTNSMEYLRAAGDFRTRLFDNEGYIRTQQGPAPLASYPPRSKNGILVPLKVRQLRKRVKG